MRQIRLLFSASLFVLLANCSTGSTRGKNKPPAYQGRILTGVTEYYHPGSKPRSIASDNSSNFAPLKEARRPSWFTRTRSSSGPIHTCPPAFSNPDGTTSRVIGNTLVRSDGTTGDMIGNTAFHPNGTTSRIVGDTLINANGSKSRMIGNNR